MPTYVYACSDPEHPRQEVVHRMSEIVEICCACGQPMHRVPQAFRWGFKPFDVLLDNLETKYRKNHYRRSLSQ
jgi:hypothetical protein